MRFLLWNRVIHSSCVNAFNSCATEHQFLRVPTTFSEIWVCVWLCLNKHVRSITLDLVCFDLMCFGMHFGEDEKNPSFSFRAADESTTKSGGRKEMRHTHCVICVRATRAAKCNVSSSSTSSSLKIQFCCFFFFHPLLFSLFLLSLFLSLSYVILVLFDQLSQAKRERKLHTMEFNPIFNLHCHVTTTPPTSW